MLKDPRFTVILTGARGTVLGSWGVDIETTEDDQGRNIGYNVTEPAHVDRLAEELQVAIEDHVPLSIEAGPEPAEGPPYDAATATGMYDRDC